MTPTVEQINQNIIAQLQASLNQRIPLLPRSFLRVISKVIAAVYVIVYKYAGFTALQQFVETASDQPTDFNGRTVRPLILWGRLIGVGDPVSAIRAELSVNVIGLTAGVLSANTALLSPSTGVTYLVISNTTIISGTTSVVIRAAGDQQGGNGSGTIGNSPAGTSLQFSSPPVFVNPEALVDAVVISGEDAETTENYRRRVIVRFQARPQGGALIDYRIWGLETAGIINVYPYTGDPGVVNVYSEAAGQTDGIPTQAQRNAVLASISLRDRRPANVRVVSLPITRSVFNVNVTGLVVDNQATVRQTITTAVTQYFLAREPFITGVSVPPRTDRITTTSVTGIVEDVVTLAGGVFTGVTLQRNSETVTTFTLGEGQKARAGTVTFV